MIILLGWVFTVFWDVASSTILVTNLCLDSLVWSHLRLRLRQKRIQAIGHKNNFFLTMFDFGIFVELCSSLFLEIVCRKRPNDELGKENQK